ncbi:hypothetical protein ACFSL4_26925 [Streptomyces caeni]|uniref:Transposase n=1 Tax=Streptomyces caeni TaxID=2307231 RepID=A0ABW4IYI9_9ACTN
MTEIETGEGKLGQVDGAIIHTDRGSDSAAVADVLAGFLGPGRDEDGTGPELA